MEQKDFRITEKVQIITSCEDIERIADASKEQFEHDFLARIE